MIVGIEGADRSGKTTLLRPLTDALSAIPITRLPTTGESAKAWPYIEPVYLHLLECLYDPGSVYVSDRSMTVSAQVYSAVFNRPCFVDPAPWYVREVIVYVETPIEVLRRRWAEEGGEVVFPQELYERVVEEYARVLTAYRVIRVDGRAMPHHNVREVCRELGRRGWLK